MTDLLKPTAREPMAAPEFPAGPTVATSRAKQSKTNSQFMERVVVWPGAKDASGWISQHSHMKNPNPSIKAGKDFVTGKVFKTVEEFMGYARWVGTTDFMYDVWFCLAQQLECTTNSKGNLKALRRGTNATWLKAIWLDIDIKQRTADWDQAKPWPHYESIQEAWVAMEAFRKKVGLPSASNVVKSGGGLHVYWISETPLSPADWRPYAEGLKALAIQEGLKCDAGLTTDVVRILRVPGTLNHKYNPPKLVEVIEAFGPMYKFDTKLQILKNFASTQTKTSAEKLRPTTGVVIDPCFDAGPNPAFAALGPGEELGAGIGLKSALLDPRPIFEQCRFLGDALSNGGAGYDNPLWHMSVFCTVFMENGNAYAHDISKGHETYVEAETQALYDRKIIDRTERGIGYPSCATIQSNGCKSCATCPLLAKGKSPLNIRPAPLPAQPIPPSELSFVDPYAEFVGPEFPIDVLPPTLAAFVKAEHRALGADPSAIAMAALGALAGAMHAETQIRAGEGWWERPNLWAVLVGDPSAMKSPIIAKVTKPLSRIDHEQDKRWREVFKSWRQDPQNKKTDAPPPARPPRCVINDATPEKVAEILSRYPSGSLLVQDEIAGWLDSFERYNSGSSRAFYLQSWNGGTFLKDRVGAGKRDFEAEIRVDNLALSIIGGIQPEKLKKIADLTCDGLLQRFLPVLMKSAERGDQYHPVAKEEASYEELIRSINESSPQQYDFADDALEVRDRMLDYLHRLERVTSFQSSLIGAIGKLKGYFARICLVLQVSQRHDIETSNVFVNAPFSVEGDDLYKIFGLDRSDVLSAGINIRPSVSCHTAEAAERVVREFLLPHLLGFYDVVVNGGQERDKLRSIADFILASDKDRLRPSDITAGVRTFRGEPEHKIREWAGRFCAMDWLSAEELKPGAPPKAWLVAPGLRQHFVERRGQAAAARAEAHAILKAGGSRKRP